MSGESDPVSIGDNGDGTLSVSGYDATSFGERFLQDADEATRHQAWERVTAQSAAAFMTPTSVTGRQGIDSMYLVCAQDRSTSVELRRLHGGPRDALRRAADRAPPVRHPSRPGRRPPLAARLRVLAATSGPPADAPESPGLAPAHAGRARLRPVRRPRRRPGRGDHLASG